MTAASPGGDNSSQALQKAVTTAGVMRHLQQFELIGDETGSRASGTPGYADSRDYVVQQLRNAGYRPTVQAFDFPFFEQLEDSVFEQTAPTPTTYVEDTDYGLMTYSGSGDVTAPVEAVDLNLGDLPAPRVVVRTPTSQASPPGTSRWSAAGSARSATRWSTPKRPEPLP